MASRRSLILCALFACTSLDDLASEAANDAGPPDAAAADSGTTDSEAPDVADASTGDPCAPTPGNLLVGQNEDFENGCALWTTDRADLAASTTTHCGKQACRVCPWQAQGSASLALTLPKRAGERYVFSVWMRREGDTSSVKASARIDLRDYTVLEFGSTPLMTEWGVSTATIDVPTGFENDDLRVGVALSGGSEEVRCFIIDDAVLVRTKDAGP